jgi:hypothetical protein
MGGVSSAPQCARCSHEVTGIDAFTVICVHEYMLTVCACMIICLHDRTRLLIFEWKTHAERLLLRRDPLPYMAGDYMRILATGFLIWQVPLLDMERYHKLLAGASWMEEYGDPEAPGVWDGHLAGISPYQRLRGDACLGSADWAGCPRTLFTTSTKDDRVHPGHARKMVKALLDEVPAARGGGTGNVFYWENTEGGHGGAADNKQRAFMWAPSYDFLWQSLAAQGPEQHNDTEAPREAPRARL